MSRFEGLAPVVKPLEWVKTYSNGNTYHAETLLGTWTVWEIDGRSFVRAPGDSGGRHVGETIGDAKLVAFSEVSERILCALSLAPVTPQQAAEVLLKLAKEAYEGKADSAARVGAMVADWSNLTDSAKVDCMAKTALEAIRDPEPTEWQPIETAPRDGTRIIAAHNRTPDNELTEPYETFWGVGKQHYVSGLPGLYRVNDGKPCWLERKGVKMAPTPTHWKEKTDG